MIGVILIIVILVAMRAFTGSEINRTNQINPPTPVEEKKFEAGKKTVDTFAVLALIIAIVIIASRI